MTLGTSSSHAPVTSSGPTPILVETGIDTESDTHGADEETSSQNIDESPRTERARQSRTHIRHGGVL